jgi:hypothetical protein
MMGRKINVRYCPFGELNPQLLLQVVAMSANVSSTQKSSAAAAAAKLSFH